MPTIFEKIDKRLKKLENKIDKVREDKIRKEYVHQRIEELYRGKDFFEKLKGIIKVLTA